LSDDEPPAKKTWQKFSSDDEPPAKKPDRKFSSDDEPSATKPAKTLSSDNKPPAKRSDTDLSYDGQPPAKICSSDDDRPVKKSGKNLSADDKSPRRKSGNMSFSDDEPPAEKPGKKLSADDNPPARKPTMDYSSDGEPPAKRPGGALSSESRAPMRLSCDDSSQARMTKSFSDATPLAMNPVMRFSSDSEPLAPNFSSEDDPPAQNPSADDGPPAATAFSSERNQPLMTKSTRHLFSDDETLDGINPLVGSVQASGEPANRPPPLQKSARAVAQEDDQPLVMKSTKHHFSDDESLDGSDSFVGSIQASGGPASTQYALRKPERLAAQDGDPQARHQHGASDDDAKKPGALRGSRSVPDAWRAQVSGSRPLVKGQGTPARVFNEDDHPPSKKQTAQEMFPGRGADDQDDDPRRNKGNSPRKFGGYFGDGLNDDPRAKRRTPAQNPWKAAGAPPAIQPAKRLLSDNGHPRAIRQIRQVRPAGCGGDDQDDDSLAERRISRHTLHGDSNDKHSGDPRAKRQISPRAFDSYGDCDPRARTRLLQRRFSRDQDDTPGSKRLISQRRFHGHGGDEQDDGQLAKRQISRMLFPGDGSDGPARKAAEYDDSDEAPARRPVAQTTTISVPPRRVLARDRT
jgi:hypothetical protein